MSTCEGKVYVGQIGVLLEVETQGEDCPAVDWDNANLMEIICLLPDKTEKIFPAVLSGTKLQYITLTAEDLPLPKTYSIQAHIVGSGYNVLGETDKFTVYDKWK